MTVSRSDPAIQIPGLKTLTLDHGSLFNRLQAGHTLITGNNRLSRILSGEYNRWRIAAGDGQWPSPNIVSWRIWLDKLWESAGLQGIAGTGRAVPGSGQLFSLWESTLKTEPFAHKLLRPESLASQLRDTRQLLVDWQLDLKDPAWFGDNNENHSAFYQWNRAFEKRCARDSWISPEDRTAALGNAIMQSLLSHADTIDLLGFDEYNPSQASLLSALVKSGHAVCHLVMTPRKSAAVLLKCKDSRDELMRMSRRVRYWFENDPGCSIAIVVPDLQSRRQELERQLEEILTPGFHDSGQRVSPWNISMGTPLVRVPMIEAAFDLLKLLDKRIDIQDMGRVLRSPWLRGAVAERNSRALLEKCLRDHYPRQFKLDEAWYRAGEIKTHDRRRQELPADQHTPQPWNSPELATVFNKLMKYEGDNRGLRPASTWAESIDRLLLSLGWPLADESGNETGTQEHDDNWQALQAWRDALRELASLDATVPAFGRQTAINHLKQICREKIFQPRTPPASIQVLGLYEVSGLRFDHLWVVGLHNDNWPPGARPNPFIPGRLQRAANLPSSSPQRELEVARTITMRLLETSPDCVFSYPGQLDGEDVLPSPLLDMDDIKRVDELPGWEEDDWQGVVAKAEKPRVDSLSMPGELKHATAKGGSSILKNQALCPFRAFASNRLGAESLGIPADGISPMLHGSLVHSVLENFWKEIKTQSAFLSLDEEQLGQRVRKHVDDVTRNERGLQQRPAFRGVEADRVYRHVVDYLELEKSREAFEVVGFEKEVQAEIHGQPIRLFIDRVDMLASGDEVIIDYKTGKVEPSKWFGDRPEEPQLPLYAISARETPAAVAFAIIREDGCLYKGVANREGLLPGLPPGGKSNQYLVDAGNELTATIENWRQVLHRLMANFLAGEASVDPKHGLKTCENSYCELQPLCRVGELAEHGQRRLPEDGA